MPQLPESNSNPQTQQTHSGGGDNVGQDKMLRPISRKLGVILRGFRGILGAGLLINILLPKSLDLKLGVNA